MEIRIFWDVTQCRLVSTYRRFERIVVSIFRVKLFECKPEGNTLLRQVHIYQSTCFDILEDLHDKKVF